MKKLFVFIAIISQFAIINDIHGQFNWTIDTIDAYGDVGLHTSIKVDNYDNVHITYYDITNAQLKYSNWNGSTWNTEVVDSNNDVGKYSSIIIDNLGRKNISYYNSTNKSLKYAGWLDNNIWNIEKEIVDNDGNVGQHSSLIILNGDKPCISYYDVDNKQLKVARSIENEWQKETVDINTDVGQYTSISYSNIFNIGVSYYDITNTALKYTNYNGSLETGLVSGVVIDEETGLPIEGAIITLTGNIKSTAPTNSFGEYRIYNIPFGTGYHLFVAANDYISKELEDFDILESNRSITIDVELFQSNIIPGLFDLDPNPNPIISEIGVGGTVHRYYYVKDQATGEPAPLVEVIIEYNNDQYKFKSEPDGIVDVFIFADSIGDGNVGDSFNYSITELDGEPIIPPIDFTCEVVDREYSKYWDSNEFGKLGISFVSVDFARGSSVVLTENDASIAGAETLYVTRQGRAGVGVDFSYGVGASVTCGEIVTGGGASAGVGISRSGITEDYYQFPHQNYSNNEALVQYLLFADGNYHILDNTLIRLLSKVEEIFGQQSTLEAAYLGDKKGIDVMIGASAYANFGTPVLGGLVDVGADVSLGAEGHVLFNTIHNDQLSENEFNFGVSGSYNASAYGGLTFNLPKYENPEPIYNWPQEYEDKLNLIDEGGTRGFEFSIVKDAITSDFVKYKIKFLKRNDVSGWEEVMIYEIEGSEVYDATQSFREQFIQVNVLNDISSSIGNIRISNDLFSQLTFALFNTLYDLQTNDQGDATITYQKDIKGMTNISGFPINIKGLLGHSLLSVEVGGGTSFEEGKMMLSEKGKWVWGHHLALENYGNDIPEINTEYQDVIQDIVDEIPLWIRIGLGVINAIVPGKDNETTFYIMDSLGVDTAAYIIFPTGSFPTTIDSVYCVSWGWYGSDTKQKVSDLNPKLKRIYKTNRQRAEESFGMKYGIGGMFQLEPLDTLLVDTAYMTIIYNDSMVVDIDEKRLGMYKEDKGNHSWIHVGGVVDTLNNMVTAPITDLSLYTLAPTMPIGTFSLSPSTDSIYADSISTAVITSEIICYNNTDTVDNGELFTINTEAGTIIATDIDSETDGIQIEALNGIISFTIKSSYIAGQPKISAFSVYGSAKADTNIVYYDTIPPMSPIGLIGIAKNEKVTLTWQQNPEEDISGYIIYFDSDTAAPYEGVATVYGFPSPIIIGKDTSFTVTGLFNDSTYHFAITAYDISGNESDYSDLLTVVLTIVYEQQISLNTGWNIASFNVIPDYPQIDSVFQILIDSNSLLKVMNESGGFMQYITGSGWTNTIGNITNTEGYYIKVNSNDTLLLIGAKVPLPIEIPLQTGWNIMGYPLVNEQDALQGLQPLVNNGTLYKIMDEQGGFIQNIEGLGWLNTIGDFKPGEGYYIKVNSTTSLTLNESSSRSNFMIIQQEPLVYFDPIQGEVIYNPMNFILTLQNEVNSILTPGDEIAIFDGAFCVGATVIVDNNHDYISIVISMNENASEAINGYSVGNYFSFKFWDNETNELYTNVIPDNLNSTNFFQPLETYVGILSTNALGIKETNINKEDDLSIIVAPNPVKNKLKLYFLLSNEGYVRVHIYDAAGNELLSNKYEEQKIGWNSTIISTDALKSGLFVGKIIFTTNDNKIGTGHFKFVKM